MFDDKIQKLLKESRAQEELEARNYRLLRGSVCRQVLNALELNVAESKTEAGAEDRIVLDGRYEFWIVGDPEDDTQDKLSLGMRMNGSGFDTESVIIPKALINKRDRTAEEAQELEAYQIQVAARLAYWRKFDGRREELLPDVLIVDGYNNNDVSLRKLEKQLREALNQNWRIQAVTESMASAQVEPGTADQWWHITYTLVKNVPTNEPY